MKLCAVIPAFNSQRTIAQVVMQTRDHVAQVVVINDGSTDATARRAHEAGAHVLTNRRNHGKGHALRMAFRYVLSHGFDAVITLDADLQHDPHEIPKFIQRHQETAADLIIGNRMHSRKTIPRIRRIPNQVGTCCFSWLIGQPILDSQCGFRFYRRNVIAALPLRNNGFEAESDLLLRAGRQGFKIDFVPIRAIYFSTNGCGSYYRPIRDTYYICITFLKNWFWPQR